MNNAIRYGRGGTRVKNFQDESLDRDASCLISDRPRLAAAPYLRSDRIFNSSKEKILLVTCRTIAATDRRFFDRPSRIDPKCRDIISGPIINRVEHVARGEIIFRNVLGSLSCFLRISSQKK